MSRVSTIFLALSLCVAATPLMAQTVATDGLVQPDRATPAVSTNSNSISGFASDFLHDQKAIWTSPLHINKGDFEWLAPTAAGAGALAIFDHRISDAAKANPSLQGPSNTISNVGLIAPWAVPGTLFVVGAT